MGDATGVATDVAQGYEKNKEKMIRPFPIKPLPNELLCQILQFIIQPENPLDDSPDFRKHQLATVCRRWRDIILQTPAFWTYIRLTPRQEKSFVKAHVERSRQCPLDVAIFGFTLGEHSSFPAFLKVVEPTMHRWRSLTLPEDTVDNLLILESFGRTVFPLLARFSSRRIPNYGNYPQFFCPENVPTLRRLDMRTSTISDDFRFPPTLEKFSLNMVRYREGTFAFLQSPSLQGLKMLSLETFTERRNIQPNSINLPRLTHFHCSVTPAESLLQGLSTPNLTHLGFCQAFKENLTSVFNGMRSKWKNVRGLNLDLVPLAAHTWKEDYLEGLTALYLAAPEVQHVEARVDVLNRLLGVRRGICPIDQWERLERLTMPGDIDSLNSMRRFIVPWLKWRRSTGKPAIKIRFILYPIPGCILEVERENVLNEIGEYCDGVDIYVETEDGFRDIW